ncbi:MAG: hypothetical protein WCG93_14060 [Paludibacter sp.]
MTTLNLAYYEKKDWAYFLSVADDRETLEDEWEDWLKNFLKFKIRLVADGYVVKDITVNIRELMEYCAKNNLKNDGKTRAQFVAQKQDFV